MLVDSEGPSKWSVAAERSCSSTGIRLHQTVHTTGIAQNHLPAGFIVVILVLTKLLSREYFFLRPSV